MVKIEVGDVIYEEKVGWDLYGVSIKRLVIPSTIKVINDFAFISCGIQSVILPNNLIYLGVETFHDNSLTSITIPNSVTSIGSNAFSDNQFPNADAIKIGGDATRFDSNWTDIGFPVK